MIDLVKVSYLVTLARRLSYARAAEELGIAQPTLTRAIQSLEEQFGVRLFDRGRAGVSVTAAGMPIVDHAKALLAMADDLHRELELTAAARAGRVRFGMAPMPSYALLTATLHDRLTKAPTVSNEAVIREVEALRALLVAGEIEFFVALESQIPVVPPLRAETLGTFPIGVVVRRDHPLIKGNCSGERFPILSATRGGGLRLPSQLTDRMLGTPHVIDSYEALVKLTSTTDSILPTALCVVAGQLASGLLREWRPGRKLFHSAARLMLYTLERKSLSPAARSLIQSLRSVVRKLELSNQGLQPKRSQTG